ncbi:D-glycerate 3-kinase [Altererythrobacter atlanticus]|uniref:Nucleoside triphosphate hydrolase domain-containing protein n=1 Tax=Croceibacterium atlanticum TaxID=1267766 RepID=A0A0F7KRG3_9SPHN|nr:kinase [Croceibacterium atlanticum]AKH42189.1 nucleoside triphosphate hydrolase domain-containing protein [Croceibacterium atlanticum]MBB5733999.1 D-glycerate 3-kinase [Croceibacterium atlanticum]
MNPAVGALIMAEQLPADYREIVESHWQPLARHIADHASRKNPLIVGVNGAQGSGKTTLCSFLELLLAEHGLHAITLSLDDLYLQRTEREEMARSIHPLFATRGVPGTHEIELGMAIIDDVLDRRDVYRPAFDKANDDRTSMLVGPQRDVDILLFEGWCMGALPQDEEALARPINRLEAEEDGDGIWRREVNRRLASDYADLFARLDLLVMLAVPDFDSVRTNRRLQEEKLARNSPKGEAIMDEAALERFLAHYERLTRHMLAEMPARADILIRIGHDHRPISAPEDWQSPAA